MKKLLGFIAVMAIITLGMSSCLEGGNAEATVNYFGACDSIEYTDENNAQYDSLIKESLAKLNYTFTWFEEHAVSEESQSFYAQIKCDDQARVTWKSKTDQITLKAIANKIFELHSDSLYNVLGVHNSAELNLKPMILKTKLYSSVFGTNKNQYIFEYNKKVE